MSVARITDAARWIAVQSRTTSADGSFVYAVRTTGVFCRPSCASRKPRRENVEFFDSADDALRAGYRACQRCRPTGVKPRTERLARACRLLAGEGRTRTQDVARTLGLSNSYFQRLFKQELGVTPQQYRRRILAEMGREAMGRSRSVTESIYEAGYGSSSRFYEGIGSELGMSPSSALAGAAGERIRYAIAACSLGRILVAWTKRGVCEVGFGDVESELVKRLEQHFPRANLEASNDVEWVRRVIDAVEMATQADIPLDIRGTAFQERVWRELRRIPAGETRTYSAIAEALGEPSTVRAVAGACAKNKLAVLVPCHRVMRSDGALAGYRWGIERKGELLRREAEDAEKAG
jgi:AraC family transcriptional regulator of adaptative response/methylated-DNA-[protein]-cysteine methyltransferase